jgi:carboxypeptidase family protein
MKNKPSESNFKSIPGVASDFVRRAVAICLLLWAPGAWAFAAALEGMVNAPDGRPIKNAQVRIEAKSGKFAKTITTDAKGHYFCDGLTTGTDYKVTLVVNGSVKASIVNTRTVAGKSTELNFDLRQTKSSPKRHMVWVPQETGSHIGSTNGSWVEVDENGQVVNNNPEVIRAGSQYAKQLENGATRNLRDR